MYIPDEFAESDGDRIAALIAANPFALLVTTDADGAPFASHLPLLYDADAGTEGTIIGHMARPNPQWRHFAAGAPVLAVFGGSHAYISPSWYGHHPSVPTWNYAAIHVYGAPRIIEDHDSVKTTVARLVETMESEMPEPWVMDLPERYERGMLSGIVAFEITIERIEAKAKLSQNRGPDDRRAVIDRLEASGSDDAAGVAVLMRSVFGID